MQLDIVQKSIIGVIGLAGLLAFIVPTELAPKPAVETGTPAPAIEAPTAESIVAPQEVAIDAIEIDANEGFGEPSISGLPFDEERKIQPENSAQQSSSNEVTSSPSVNIANEGSNSGSGLSSPPPPPPPPSLQAN